MAKTEPKKKKIGRPLGSTTTEGWVTRSISFRPSKMAAMDAAVEKAGVTRSQWVNELVAKELTAIGRRARRSAKSKGA